MSLNSSYLAIMTAAGLADKQLERERIKAARDAANAQAWSGALSSGVQGLTGLATTARDTADKNFDRNIALDRLVGPGEQLPASVIPATPVTLLPLSDTNDWLGKLSGPSVQRMPAAAIPVDGVDETASFQDIPRYVPPKPAPVLDLLAPPRTDFVTKPEDDKPSTPPAPAPLMPAPFGVPVSAARDAITNAVPSYTKRSAPVLTSDLQEPLQAAKEAIPDDAGRDALDAAITSGVRTKDEQARLYAARASNPFPVAPPGSSEHETGKAIDIDLSTMTPDARAAFTKVQDTRKAQGLSYYTFNTPNDPVHATLMPADPSVTTIVGRKMPDLDKPIDVAGGTPSDLGVLPGETRDAFKARWRRQLGATDDQAEAYAQNVYDTFGLRRTRTAIANKLQGLPEDQILAAQDAVAPLPSRTTTTTATRPKVPPPAPLAEPTPIHWAMTPEQEADRYLGQRGQKPGQSSWLSQLVGIPEDNYDFHRGRLVDAIKGQRRDTEQKAFQAFRDAQKLDLERRIGESTINKNNAEAAKAAGAEGSLGKQFTAIAQNAITPTIQKYTARLQLDATPDLVTEANNAMRSEGLKALANAGIDITDPKNAVLVQSSVAQAIEDATKANKKQKVEQKQVDDFESVLDITRRMDLNAQKRKDSGWTPELQDVLKHELDSVKLPFNLDTIGEVIRDVGRKMRVTPAQQEYLRDSEALINLMMRTANGNFNVTDGDARRLVDGLISPYTTDEAFRLASENLKRDMLVRAQHNFQNYSPFWELPKDLGPRIDEALGKAPGASPDPRFANKTTPELVKPSSDTSKADQIVLGETAAPVKGLVDIITSGASKITNPLELLTGPSEAETARTGASTTGPSKPKTKPFTGNSARDIGVDARLGGKLGALKAEAQAAGVDPNAMTAALAGLSFSGSDLVKAGRKYIADHRTKR